MVKPLKLSHTAISKYNECPRKYRHYYIERIRPIALKSALVWGGCVDHGFNALLEGKDLQTAKDAFRAAWEPYRTQLVVYSKSDLDNELLAHFKLQNAPDPEWHTLLLKGYLAIETYQTEVMPLISKVLAVQKTVYLKNGAGDEIKGIIDKEIVLKDGRVILGDNKTSSVKYEPDSPRKAQQLVLYYYIEKDNVPIDEVAFFVFNKKVNKQKKKICSVCGFDGSATQHKKCNNTVKNERCNGELIITINPKIDFEMIFNKVSEKDEDRVLNDIDNATNGIKNKNFKPNFKACERPFGRCEYFGLCHDASMEGLIKK